MKAFFIFTNALIIAIVLIGVFQVIPTMISSNDSVDVATGFGLLIIVFAFIWVQGNKIYNDMKENNDE